MEHGTPSTWPEMPLPSSSTLYPLSLSLTAEGAGCMQPGKSNNAQTTMGITLVRLTTDRIHKEAH